MTTTDKTVDCTLAVGSLECSSLHLPFGSIEVGDSFYFHQTHSNIVSEYKKKPTGFRLDSTHNARIWTYFIHFPFFKLTYTTQCFLWRLHISLEFTKECIVFEWNVNFTIWSFTSNPVFFLLFSVYFIYFISSFFYYSRTILRLHQTDEKETHKTIIKIRFNQLDIPQLKATKRISISISYVH